MFLKLYRKLISDFHKFTLLLISINVSHSNNLLSLIFNCEAKGQLVFKSGVKIPIKFCKGHQ